MKIFRHKYKILSGFDVYMKIKSIMNNTTTPLTRDQESNLYKELGDSGIYGNLDMPFQAYQWEKEYPTGRNSWWRLSVILFFICHILVLPIIFGYWCISGKARLPKDWKITKIMMIWEQNIFE